MKTLMRVPDTPMTFTATCVAESDSSVTVPYVDGAVVPKGIGTDSGGNGIAMLVVLAVDDVGAGAGAGAGLAAATVVVVVVAVDVVDAVPVEVDWK